MMTMSYPKRFTAFVCFIAAMAWGLAMSGSAHAFTFEKIADNSSDFESFGLPDLNDAGYESVSLAGGFGERLRP